MARAFGDIDGNTETFAPSGGIVAFGYAEIDGPGTEGNDELEGGKYNDTIWGEGGNDLIRGHGGDDRLYGDDGGDWLDGGEGNDLLNGGTGYDYLDGGAGVDTVDYSGYYAVTVNLATGFATLSTGEVDTLVNIEDAIGSYGIDVFYGSAGSNGLFGNDGNDFITGGGGADYIHGGAGSRDQAIYRDSSVGVTVNLATGRGFGGTAEGDVLVEIEDLAGSEYNDSLLGNDGVNRLFGRAGDDLMKGAGGADRLSGDAGHDTLKGGGGADVLHGGEGYDTASYYGSPAGVFVSLLHNVGAYGDAEGDTLTAIENVTGSVHNDNLWGDDGLNWIEGLDGNDTLKGYGASDALIGGYGVDLLYGMEGPDQLDGGAGADTMVGGTGDDSYRVDDAGDVITEYAGEGHDLMVSSVSYTLATGVEVEVLAIANTNDTAALNLTGNEYDNELYGNEGANVITGGRGVDNIFGFGGADTFVWRSTDESGVTVPTMDLISGFNRGEGDRIDLGQVDADIYAAGNQAFAFIGAAPFSGTPGEINYVHVGNETIIQLQTGTSPDIEAGIRIAGIVTPEASWFVL